MEERLLNVETKIAYNENTIKELSDIIFEQQQRIDSLEDKLNIMIKQYRALAEGYEKIRDEKPPHY